MFLLMEPAVHCQHGGTTYFVCLLHPIAPCLQNLTLLDVYTSATVLIAGRLYSAILAEITEESITQSWNCALEILRKYQSYSTSARRCVAALEILYEQVAYEASPSTYHRPSGDIENSALVAINDMSFGEGVDASILDSFEFPDFQDMSWLNSVPSNLF
jgi:hypothetical protein